MIKQAFVLIAFVGSVTASAAQTPNTQTLDPQTKAALAARTCALPEIANTAPLEPVSGSDLMTVPMMINGTSQKFLLDLGVKKPTAVSPELMAKLGLPEDFQLGQRFGTALGEGPFESAGFSNVMVCDARNGGGGCGGHNRLRAASVTIGNATGHHVQIQVAPKGEISRSASFDGYFTGDYMRKYDVELDFAGKQMTWLTPTACTDPDQVVFWAHDDVAIIPVSLAKDGRLEMQAMVGGHVINAELDTSSANTVMRRDIAELYVGLNADKDLKPVDGLEDGMHMKVYVHIFPQIIFAGGSITAVNVPVMVQNYSMIPAVDRDLNTHLRGIAGGGLLSSENRIPDLVIGMDVLKHLHMYVVPGQAKVYVTAAG
jgi:hypothetical protein